MGNKPIALYYLIFNEDDFKDADFVNKVKDNVYSTYPHLVGHVSFASAPDLNRGEAFLSRNIDNQQMWAKI